MASRYIGHCVQRGQGGECRGKQEKARKNEEEEEKEEEKHEEEEM